ncbi:hypothetical protein [Streptomyces sp. NPDC097619]|uniref:hypothetical protein n=1 Tax=Streptomyces sp. NPDC097619 TaxID=3157228 RepID=UPI0033292317
MSVPVHTAHPRPPTPPALRATAPRLAWWTLALPVLAFTALMALLTGPGAAEAAGGGAAGLGRVMTELLRILL